MPSQSLDIVWIPVYIISIITQFFKWKRLTSAQPLIKRRQSLHILLGNLEIQLGILADALLARALGQHHKSALHAPPQHHACHRHATPRRHSAQHRILHAQPLGQRRVRLQDDPVRAAELDNVGARAKRVQLDLVDGGRELEVGRGEQLLQMADPKVADAGRAHLAGGDGVLEGAPAFAPRTRAAVRRVQQVQVEGAAAARGGAGADRGARCGVVGVGAQLGRQRDGAARNVRVRGQEGGDGGGALGFVFVPGGRVDAAVAGLRRARG